MTTHSAMPLIVVQSCDLGKLNSGGMVLKVNYLSPTKESEQQHEVSAAFAFGDELAFNVAATITDLLCEGSVEPNPDGPSQ